MLVKEVREGQVVGQFELDTDTDSGTIISDAAKPIIHAATAINSDSVTTKLFILSGLPFN